MQRNTLEIRQLGTDLEQFWYSTFRERKPEDFAVEQPAGTTSVIASPHSSPPAAPLTADTRFITPLTSSPAQSSALPQTFNDLQAPAAAVSPLQQHDHVSEEIMPAIHQLSLSSLPSETSASHKQTPASDQ